MTEVRSGDILKFTFAHDENEYFFVKATKVEDGGGFVGSLHDRGTTSLYDDVEIGYSGIHVGKLGARLEFVSRPLAFVGPKPTGGPKIVLPLQAVDHTIEDANGTYVGEIGAEGTSASEDEELAALIVELLNKHFGGVR